MKAGDIVCWQYWDNQLQCGLSSIKHDKKTVLNYFPFITLLAYWRIKKLK